MKLSSTQPTGSGIERRVLESGGARTVLLLVVVAILGIAVGTLWVSRSTKRGSAAETPALTESTKAVLRRLDSPLEIRFYSILDPAIVANGAPGFSGRVDRLLAAYQQEAPGRINVTRVDSTSASAAKAASEDGIKAFNLEKGEACYLGLALVLKGRKESLPELWPEWEPALESDLSRAIARLVEATQPAKAPPATAKAEAAAAEEVERAIPNAVSVSLEEGKRILREAALKEFKAAATEMEQQVKEAQRRLSQAQNGGSAAEQQAAMKNLQQIQADQTEKLQQIAARSKAQIEAFEHLKAGGR